MKRTSILLLIAILLTIYSCVNQTSSKKQNDTDSTATNITEQVKTNDKIAEADLYKYFSKEEIKQKMDKAEQVLSGNSQTFEELLKEEGFAVSPENLEKKIGKS